jgi:hypothetical protein
MRRGGREFFHRAMRNLIRGIASPNRHSHRLRRRRNVTGFIPAAASREPSWACVACAGKPGVRRNLGALLTSSATV